MLHAVTAYQLHYLQFNYNEKRLGALYHTAHWQWLQALSCCLYHGQ